ncbi:MAG: leucine-rich repeat domain-containing protein [Chloroflexota bacterium]
MQADNEQTLLQEAIALVKAGDRKGGRQRLSALLKRQPENVTAWLWMAGAVDEDAQRRFCLERVLQLDPGNQVARRGLESLQPRPPAEVAAAPQPAQAAQAAIPHSAAPETPAQPAAQPEADIAPARDRQVWLNPKNTQDRVVALESGVLYVANPSEPVLARARTAFDQDLPLAALVTPRLAIPLEQVRRASADRHGKSISIRYNENERLRLELLIFDEAGQRDDFLKALHERLAPGFALRQEQFNPLQAAILPGILLAAVALLTYLFYMAALESQAGVEAVIRGRYAFMKQLAAWAIELLGPTGIVIVGGLLGLALAAWLLRRVANPPLMATLAPAAGGKAAPGRAERPAQASPPAAPLAVDAPSPDRQEAASPGEGETLAAPDQPAPARKDASTASQRSKRRLTNLIIWLAVFTVVCMVSAVMLSVYFKGQGIGYPGLIEGGMVLDLRNQGLQTVSFKGLPTENLVLVDLSDNHLTSLPSDLSALAGIEMLYIKNSGLQSLPPAIGQLKNLRILILSGNQLTTLPPEIGELTLLKNLDLQHNRLQSLPPEIGRLKSLKKLNVQFNPIQIFPSELSSIPNLEILRSYAP